MHARPPALLQLARVLRAQIVRMMRSRRCAGVCTRESVLNIEPMQKNAQVGLSHIIQHDIRRDARNHINTTEFIAGVFE